MAYSAIDKATSFAESKIYTGTGSSQTITGLGFEPDFTWIKCRGQGYGNRLFNTVQGATVYTQSNATSTGTDANSLSAWTSDGFTVISALETNANTEKYVSWNWKAGTTSGIAGSPSITPAGYTFNATSGFSVLKWAGTGSNGTLPHGLGVAPQMIIVKRLEGSNWICGHESLGWTKSIIFNEAEQVVTNTRWQDTSPTSTLFYVDDDTTVNASGSNYIAYVWAGVKGYSRMGSYQGNGDSDGPFVYTGFRPSFVMIKCYDANVNWTNRDNARDIFNPGYNYIYPNLNNAGTNITIAAGMTGSYPVDFYATGFKINNTDDKLNTSGDHYIYAAFGQTIVGTNGVVGTAR